MSISHRLLERRSSSMVRYLRFCIRNNTSYSSTICAKIPYAHFLRLNNTLDGVNYSLSNEYPVSCIFAGLLVKLTNFCLKYTGQTTIEDTPWSTRGQIKLPLNFFLICASCCFEIVWFIVANVNFFFQKTKYIRSQDSKTKFDPYYIISNTVSESTFLSTQDQCLNKLIVQW